MEGRVFVSVESTSAFAGEVDTLRFTGYGILDKTDYGCHLRYHATNTADGSPMDSDVKWDAENGRLVVIQESGQSGYGLLLDPKATTATQIAEGLTLHVQTASVGCHIGDYEGAITMNYTLLAGQQVMSALSVTIKLGEKKV